MTPDQLDKALRAAVESDARTIRQLAADAGIPQSTLHRYFIDGKGMKWESAAKLIAALGMRLEINRD